MGFVTRTLWNFFEEKDKSVNLQFFFEVVFS